MDYSDDGGFVYQQRQRLQPPRPPMLQTSRTDYASIAEGLDAKVVVMGNSGAYFSPILEQYWAIQHTHNNPNLKFSGGQDVSRAALH